ncbi:hypothetical protein JOB18_005334 [Solea senegalensis]|nr:hypothetical protein JOB18_005334 [Solea senegalensis]
MSRLEAGRPICDSMWLPVASCSRLLTLTEQARRGSRPGKQVYKRLLSIICQSTLRRWGLFGCA